MFPLFPQQASACQFWRHTAAATAALQGFQQALWRTRTADPLLTMRCARQPIAIHGNGFRLFWPPAGSRDLPLIATGCNHGAP